MTDFASIQEYGTKVSMICKYCYWNSWNPWTQHTKLYNIRYPSDAQHWMPLQSCYLLCPPSRLHLYISSCVLLVLFQLSSYEWTPISPIKALIWLWTKSEDKDSPVKLGYSLQINGRKMYKFNFFPTPWVSHDAHKTPTSIFLRSL